MARATPSVRSVSSGEDRASAAYLFPPFTVGTSKRSEAGVLSRSNSDVC